MSTHSKGALTVIEHVAPLRSNPKHRRELQRRLDLLCNRLGDNLHQSDVDAAFDLLLGVKRPDDLGASVAIDFLLAKQGVSKFLAAVRMHRRSQ